MSKFRDDPRDARLTAPASLPPQWKGDGPDAFGGSGMMLGGLTMVTRNPIIAWFTVTFALWGWLNAQPLRTKDGGTAGQGALFAAAALVAVYLPRFFITPA